MSDTSGAWAESWEIRDERRVRVEGGSMGAVTLGR